MSLLMGAAADWQESIRRWLYPRLHPHLEQCGGYGVGHVGYNQYVGSVDEDEEVIEEELAEAGARRNPIAAYKSLADGRRSEGSWVFLHRDVPFYVEPGMQLHVTLFERADGRPGRELYAHYEDDWRVRPLDHLDGERFSAELGVILFGRIVDEHTFLTLHE